jgi:phosphoglycerate dehydrogenase-like enzyme
VTTNILVLEKYADIYERTLAKEFSGIAVHKAATMADIKVDLAAIDVLFAFGIAIDDGLIARMTNLKWIASLATGVDHFLRCPSLMPDVLITSGRGIHGPPMREAVLYMMMAIGRDATRQVGDNKAHVWERRFWNLLYGKTVAIVGIGVVGIAIGELLKALGMTVIGVTRTPRAVAGFDDMTPTDRLADAARRADFLINVLPATIDNLGVFDTEVFAAMKPSAYFINGGRGQTVDEAALIAALRERRIAGAGLDVFQNAPLPVDSPFWDLPNVFITPNVGGYIVEYEDLIIPLVIDNMRLFLAGRQSEMQNIVAH